MKGFLHSVFSTAWVEPSSLALKRSFNGEGRKWQLEGAKEHE